LYLLLDDTPICWPALSAYKYNEIKN